MLHYMAATGGGTMRSSQRMKANKHHVPLLKTITIQREGCDGTKAKTTAKNLYSIMDQKKHLMKQTTLNWPKAKNNASNTRCLS